MERVVRPAVRATWRRPTWLTVKKKTKASSVVHVFFCVECLMYRVVFDLPVTVFTHRNQRECVLDAPSRGQPQQDLWVPGAVLTLQGPAHVTRWLNYLFIYFVCVKSSELKSHNNHDLCLLRPPFMKMVTSTKMQSTTCATVSPATSSEATRRITRGESHLATTPCPSGGAASPSGETTSSQSDTGAG